MQRGASPPEARRRAAGLGLAGLMVLSAGPALTQAGGPPAFPAFPQAATFAGVQQWLADETNLSADHVVLLSAEAAFSFEGEATLPDENHVVRRQLREEVTSQDLAGRLGGRSVTAQVEFDCAHAESKVDNVTLYAGNSLGGGGRAIPASQWMKANADLDLTDLAQAACGGAFHRPFEDAPPTRAAAAGRTRSARPAPASAVSALEPSRPAATGDRWVQIGAFDTVAIAREKWRRIAARLPRETAGRGVRTETVQRGAAQLQRALVGPFADHDQAAAFCARYKAIGGDCIVR